MLRHTRFIALSLLVLLQACGSEATKIRVTTWNLKWFPNGSPREATSEQQTTNIKAAADILRQLSPDVILLQEIRDDETCQRLADAIERGVYKVAICSAFKEPGQKVFGKQQVAILAKDWPLAAWMEEWKSLEGIDPPRGFAFAWLKIRNKDIGVYSVHLKSNLIMHGDKDVEMAKNIRKREIAAEQLVGHSNDITSRVIPAIKSIIIAGDWNTNRDEFYSDRTLDIMKASGFLHCFEGMSLTKRVTRPANGGYPDATFDYVFGKNVETKNPVITKTDISDHYAVTVSVEL